MTAKFIQYFDVVSGKEEECREFLSRNYIRGINETGVLGVAGSWFVAAGEGPYCILEGVARSMKEINVLLQMDEFQKLNHLLHFLVTNYRTKILVPAGNAETVVPQGLHYRFNHHYNVLAESNENYGVFLRDTLIPTMDALGIRMIGRWNVAVGPGPMVVTEGSCDSVKAILEGIGSVEYREIVSKLLTMVSGFGSKILVPTGLVM